MNKSDLINAIAEKQAHLFHKDVVLAVDLIVERLCQAAITNERVEIRGFGVFSVHHYAARQGRNPKTGEIVSITPKSLLHFKPGKELKERVHESLKHTQIE